MNRCSKWISRPILVFILMPVALQCGRVEGRSMPNLPMSFRFTPRSKRLLQFARRAEGLKAQRVPGDDASRTGARAAQPGPGRRGEPAGEGQAEVTDGRRSGMSLGAALWCASKSFYDSLSLRQDGNACSTQCSHYSPTRLTSKPGAGTTAPFRAGIRRLQRYIPRARRPRVKCHGFRRPRRR